MILRQIQAFSFAEIPYRFITLQKNEWHLRHPEPRVFCHIDFYADNESVGAEVLEQIG